MSNRDEPAVDIRLALDYRHGVGAYARYFDALARGVALASRDRNSGRVSFPPRAVDDPSQWFALSGVGEIVALTRGPSALPLARSSQDACFALIAMHGADNLCFGRIDESFGTVREGQCVRLRAPADSVAHPAQRVCFVLDRFEPAT